MADMAYSLEQEMLERGLQPRLCYLTKGDRGFGFHLHGERHRGAQFIRKIEPGSPADLAGLRSGDRVVEVNGENVEKDSHHQVVEKIMAVEHRTRLLVVDRETDEFLRFHNLPCTEELAVETGCLSPRASSLTSSPRTSCSSSPLVSLSPSPRDSITPPFSRGCSDKPRMAVATGAMDKLAFIMNGNKTPPISPSVLIGSPTRRRDPFTPLLLPPSPSPSHTESDCHTDLSTTPTCRQEEAVVDEQDEVMLDLRPRLCCMALGNDGYGFNLHCDKSRVGQFVRSVDPDSPADRAGLRPGDRVVEVNDRSIEGMKHAEVVAFIRHGQGCATLLVVDPETDTLFKRLGITPTTEHLKEDCVDGPLIESPVSNCPITDSSASPSPITDGPLSSPPIINITLTDPPITNGSLKHQGSSSSHSTISDTSLELRNLDTASKIFGDLDRHKRHSAPAGHQELKPQKPTLDPFIDSGLRLSPTAAEAKQKVRAKKANKRAPPMDWSKKQELFSNF
ncbi:Na(+)/H(+) exchange regulatory cofactor NHE-RF2 [Astyanax mexicanus]|uniref:Na(+)/H(+) exchange regulatory cofactor NHE-RF2 n=1 Tax=Astyanax mexicanus TaxID=7994 RepID=UPI000BBD6978|nr:Na(+)/H(+) exchange regulatory cofactor NHE-RF2 [Astyanax mexicanus]